MSIITIIGARRDHPQSSNPTCKILHAASDTEARHAPALMPWPDLAEKVARHGVSCSRCPTGTEPADLAAAAATCTIKRRGTG
eukprot:6427679-Prymnesium_polylepis.1